MKFKVLAEFCVFILLASSAHAEAVDPAAIVVEHNKWRTGAGVTEQLQYSLLLAASAQSWANHLKLSQNCHMKHSNTNGQYGENLYWTSALLWSDGRKELSKTSPAQVIDYWANEKENYDHVRNECVVGTICGHYTQIVWRETTEVGCGMAICNDSREQVWVCHYQPAGNILGERPY